MSRHENPLSAVLDYWFGHAEQTIQPSEQRWSLWFAGLAENDEAVKQRFASLHRDVVNGVYDDHLETARGSLAIIIVLDQFSRMIYRQRALAFQADERALAICLQGIEKQQDHNISLIERVFYYMPLMHAENIEMQTLSVRAYQMLLALSFQETRSTFEKFLYYAMRHYQLIEKFNRFPHRNVVIGRQSTDRELQALKDPKNSF